MEKCFRWRFSLSFASSALCCHPSLETLHTALLIHTPSLTNLYLHTFIPDLTYLPTDVLLHF